ncbi:DNA replication/repair protein RecF [Rubritepida flocculans]|uniref:DNA replication/repair protein RecF n=1 Tax=Rubritepida flocculans TaxID=182403 RepID=UPI0003F4C6AD|nr:DNA replication/repair protein RecF [Rubritepida flocculans]
MLRLTRLRLSRFRNHHALDLRFAARAVVFAGPNGAGKTNLLEAISLLGPGRGLRGARVAELAEGGAGPWAVSGRFEDAQGPFEIGTGAAEEGGAERRAFFLDGERARSQSEIAERVATVWITPQMDRLFQESAGARRRFLDRLVLALEPHHAREVAAYETAMAHRNRLLGGGRRADPAWLAGLEDAMARHGVAAAASRRALVARLNAAMAGGVAGAFPAAHLELRCPAGALLAEMPALAAEEALRAAWAESRAKDAAAGATLSGPHRAELLFTHVEKAQPAALCSTGEQKALLVSTVLAHAALIGRARGFAPILLLDELPAHLDAGRRAALFAALAALPGQSFLTGTEAHPFQAIGAEAEFFALEPGGIRPAPLG